MKKILMIISGVLLLFSSCKKEEVKQYSYWTINGQEYSSNNVRFGTNKTPVTRLSSLGKVRFDFQFFTSALPSRDSLLVIREMVGYPSGKVLIYFYIDTVIYKPSVNERKHLKANQINGKIRYTLPEMLFINKNNANDSIWVKGIFNEP